MHRKRLWALCCTLLVLCGCRTAPSPAQQTFLELGAGDAAASASLPDELTGRLMKDYIQIYEKYCGGEELGSHRLSAAGLRRYLYGWLYEMGLSSRYAVYDGANASRVAYYTIPRTQADGFSSLFFAQSLPDSYTSRFVTQPDALAPEGLRVELDSAQPLQNGVVQLTVRRFFGEREWYPAVYTFRPTVLERPLDLLSGVISPGEQVWQFVSVRSLPLESNSGVSVTLSTPSDLLALAQLVNSGDWAYQDNIYQLAGDIDMNGIAFPPIGSYRASDPRDPAPNGFCAAFDGKGHTIKNLRAAPASGPAGLFASVGRQGMVSNLRLENCEISAPLSIGEEPETPAGGIAGMVMGGSLQRCEVTGSIIARSGPAGGLAGALEEGSSVWNCTARAQVRGQREAGGLVGRVLSSQVNNCLATGSVETSALESPGVGGLIGYGSDALVDHGIASVAVAAPPNVQWAGSFIGSGGGKLVSCFFNTDLSAQWKTIGIPQSDAPHDLTGLSGRELSATGIPIAPQPNEGGD